MEFRILGPLEVVDDGRIVKLDRPRLRALLAYLLLHANEPIASDRIIEEVWGPEPPKTAAASFQNHVSLLRKAIGAAAVVSEQGAYTLRVDPERFDLARFERLTGEARGAGAQERAEKLRAALALWRGPALDDLAYEPFARDAIGRLEEARLAAVEDCVDAELELGRDGELIRELEALVEQHPLRERFSAQLMRALYRAGRQADALAAFQAALEVLREELGLDPGEELRRLQQAILRHDPALATSRKGAVERRADRRTVTVLFCDLVGSTELASQLDPEAYRALITRYFELVREPLERHGATLEKFIGDAVMAVFGVPTLREDDALRAVRAAVEVQESLRTAGIAARVGISSGEVHVLSAEGAPLHVSGPPASAAAQLEAEAGTGGILLSDATHALVRDAVRAERDGGAWRLVEVVPGEPAYARRTDTPFVGRADALTRLHRVYEDARASGHARVATVVGEGGIGKTRLLRELLLPLRDEARILVGRCASYGDGATYLPFAEMVRSIVAEASLDGIRALLASDADADRVATRVAEITGLADAPAAPGEAFWAVRRFVEALAHERPAVLVFDDIHWAEPTLLDLIEYLGEWTDAAVLVLCAAREELLEHRPAWGGPTSTGFVVELAPLASKEMTALVQGLSECSLDAGVAERVVEQAGGNPLFAEQLLALAQEAPGSVDATPRTIEALIASRLDRLDPHELTVLRRASVIGRRFTRVELGDLTPIDEAAGTDRHLGNLSARALIHPRDHVFAFHHVLVRDVAYRGLPKADRARLHELAGVGLERRDTADEVVGYHFEQAHTYLTELASDREHAQDLAAAAGEKLGRAGIRAWQRADVTAAVNLLTRAVTLTPDAGHLACELGLALTISGEHERAVALFTEISDRGQAQHRVRAQLELGLLRSLSDPEHARLLLELAIQATSTLEAAGDYRALGRACYCIAHVRGGFLCEYGAMEAAAERMAGCYRRAGWPLSAPVEMLGLALEFGPRPVDEAIARLADYTTEDAQGRWTHAAALVWLARLEAMRANFDAARAHLEGARTAYEDLGVRSALIDSCGRAAAAIELLAGELASAEQSLRDACAFVQQLQQTSVLATRAAELANVLYEQRRYDEAWEWTTLATESSGEDDLDAALTRQPVEAKLRARRGHVAEAEQLARATVALAERTDALNRRAESLLALAEVLEIAGSADEPQQHTAAALRLYERKGNAAAAARVRAQHEEPHAELFVPEIRSS